MRLDTNACNDQNNSKFCRSYLFFNNKFFMWSLVFKTCKIVKWLCWSCFDNFSKLVEERQIISMFKHLPQVALKLHEISSKIVLRLIQLNSENVLKLTWICFLFDLKLLQMDPKHVLKLLERCSKNWFTSSPSRSEIARNRL